MTLGSKAVNFPGCNHPVEIIQVEPLVLGHWIYQWGHAGANLFFDLGQDCGIFFSMVCKI